MTGDVAEKDLDKSLFCGAIEKPVSMSKLAGLIEGVMNVTSH
jgi:hypothetical protein